jgi:enamine deaminase RidA (YjgF/YER057c/UK114 family)
VSGVRHISSGSSFEALAGYSRAVVDGDWSIVDDAVQQTHQCFSNISAALAQADASLDDVIRVRYLLTDASLFDQVAPVFGQYFARARPAATAMVVGLIDPRMKIEIEVTARHGASSEA